MADAEQRLGAALRIIEGCPHFHMGPTVSFYWQILGSALAPDFVTEGRSLIVKNYDAIVQMVSPIDS